MGEWQGPKIALSAEVYLSIKTQLFLKGFPVHYFDKTRSNMGWGRLFCILFNIIYTSWATAIDAGNKYKHHTITIQYLIMFYIGVLNLQTAICCKRNASTLIWCTITIFVKCTRNIIANKIDEVDFFSFFSFLFSFFVFSLFVCFVFWNLGVFHTYEEHLPCSQARTIWEKGNYRSRSTPVLKSLMFHIMCSNVN